MLDSFELKKFAGSFFGSRRKSAEIKEINPRRDWNIILSLFVLAVFVILAFGSYSYWRINSGGFFAASHGNELPTETIDRVELKKIIKYYESKNQLFEKSKITKPEIIDPSL